MVQTCATQSPSISATQSPRMSSCPPCGEWKHTDQFEDEASRTVIVGNLDQRVTEELLFELFLHAGPLVRTTIPREPECGFGVVLYKDKVSVPYAVALLNRMPLYGRHMHVVNLVHGCTLDVQHVSQPTNTTAQ